MSTMRIISESVPPPKNPAMAPKLVPITTAMSVARMPTLSEIRAPYTTRENRSRPTESVPNQWSRDGPTRNSGVCSR